MSRLAQQTILWTIVVFLASVFAATAQSESECVRALFVDETKSFTSTMRVAALVGAVRSLGTLDVTVRLVDVDSSYADPQEGEVPDEAPYDLIVIVPRGLDRGEVDVVWVLSEAFTLLDAVVRGIVRFACFAVDQVFAGMARAVDVQQALFPALLRARYAKEGWTP